MDVKYVRCVGCSFVYDSDLRVCPQCGSPLSIQEDLNDIDKVFNICDGD